MITAAPKLTDVGKSLLIRGIGGDQLTFTKFKIGNGELNGSEAAELTDIINPLVEFGVTEVAAYDEGYVMLTGGFDSDDITGDFRWTELGVFAKGADGRELLYAYTNDSENAGMLRANATDVSVEQTVSIIVAIGTAENVTALITPRKLYASKEEFDNHINSKCNPHGITPEMLGLGNVDNVGTNDQKITYSIPATLMSLVSGEKISTAFGKIARAIISLSSHLSARTNPHHVTASQISAAQKEHSHSANDINSGVLGVPRGGTGVKTLDELKEALSVGVATGTYQGDGNVKRQIELGFKPTAVLLMNDMGMTSNETHGTCGGLCIGAYGVVRREGSDHTGATEWNDDNTAMLISDNGFFVNENSEYLIHTNANGESYRYIAWR